MSALEERRQRACEAGYDAIGEGMQAPASSCIEDAVEAATRVQITEEMCQATGLPALAARAVLTAAFKIAGFEVEE